MTVRLTSKILEPTPTIADDAISGAAELIQEHTLYAASNSFGLVGYKHDAHKQYKYHRDSPRRWSLLVTAVDMTKTDESAFYGKYLSIAKEHLIPKYSIVVEMDCAACTAYRIIGDYAKEEIDTGFRGAIRRLVLAVSEAQKKN